VCGNKGTLVIQFSLANVPQTRAIEAIDNLKRRLLQDVRRSRRNVDTAARLIRSTLNNKTITPTGIYNWTGTVFSRYY